MIFRGKAVHIGNLFIYLFLGSSILFLILPMVVIIPVSFSSSRFIDFPPRQLSLQWYSEFFADRKWIDATLTTLKVALSSTFMALALGAPAAYGIHRLRSHAKKLMTAFVLSPMIIPSIIYAIGIYFYFSDLYLVDTVLGLAIAHTPSMKL